MKKKIGKNFSVNISMPDNRNRVRIQSITYTKQGIIDNLKCPNCSGDGHFLDDNTSASGGNMIPRLCNFCDGSGKIKENMVEDIQFDHEGEPIIIYKEGGHSYGLKE